MNYQVFVWFKPNTALDQVKKEIKDIESHLSGCAKVQSENLGKSRLAYKIKGFEEGIQVIFRLDCEAGRIPELATFLNRHESVLRYLTMRDGK